MTRIRLVGGLIMFHLILMLQACSPSGATEECRMPSDRYINMTVLNQCPGKMPADIPHFCFEMVFKDSLTVEMNNGFEKFPLRFEHTGQGCDYTLSNASLHGDMTFRLINDSTIILLDTAWTQLDTGTVFKRMRVSEGGYQRFEDALNDCVLTGEYSLFKNGELIPHTVTILPNGQLNGLKPYMAYELCYAGDCLEETSPPSRTIALIDDKGQRDVYAFKNIEGKMALELYSLAPPVPDVKGERAIGPMVYELRTE